MGNVTTATSDPITVLQVEDQGCKLMMCCNDAAGAGQRNVGRPCGGCRRACHRRRGAGAGAGVGAPTREADADTAAFRGRCAACCVNVVVLMPAVWMLSLELTELDHSSLNFVNESLKL